MFDIFSASGFFVHTPCGPRKSGMPESVEMPAPVRTTTRCASSIHVVTVSIMAAILPRRATDTSRDGADLARRRHPDADDRHDAERDREPPARGVAAGAVVDRARHPRRDAATGHGGRVQHAEDRRVALALEELG